MIELVVDYDVVNQEDLANLQNDMLENGDARRSIVPR
jgi:hypothetical protein